MELVFIFCIGWVASHAFGEKRDEYEHAQDAHREKYMNRLATRHPNWSKARQARYLQNAARRNALGHMAYLLRHGWSSTFNDVAHGWKTAKGAHEEWKAERAANGDNPSVWETFKAGFRRNKAAREAEKAKAAAVEQAKNVDQEQAKPVPAPRQPEPPVGVKPTPAAQPDNDTGKGADVLTLPTRTGTTTKTPGNTAGSTNGSTTVEYNLDASKAAISEIGTYATSKISMLEQIIADAIAGENLSRDTEAMTHLANLQEALSNVRAHANAFVDSSTKHAGGQEYANTGHAASTEYLKSN